MSTLFHKDFKVYVLPEEKYDYTIFADGNGCSDIDNFFESEHKKVRNTLFEFIHKNSETKVIKWCLFLDFKIFEPNYKVNPFSDKRKKRGSILIKKVRSRDFITFKPIYVYKPSLVLSDIFYEQVRNAFINLYDKVYDLLKSFCYRYLDEVVQLKIVCIDYTNNIE